MSSVNLRPYAFLTAFLFIRAYQIAEAVTLSLIHIYEATRHITPAASSKKIAIIGAGIAGLEAARVAALRGHSVTISYFT